MKILKKKYKGLGFVESLIAISVSGVVGIVLMSISASTLQKLHQLDIQDALAAHAVSTAVDLQKIAIEDIKLPDQDKQFYEGNLTEGNCYGFDNTGKIDSTIAYGLDEREAYKNLLVNPQSEYFRIFCIKSNDNSKVIVEIVTGSNKVDGIATTDSDVKDYSYLAVINK